MVVGVVVGVAAYRCWRSLGHNLWHSLGITDGLVVGITIDIEASITTVASGLA